jgi:hypothetical protein
VNGYGHPDYAASLAEFGAPRRLPRSGGTLLEREIEGLGRRDAMGCYPLFACDDWSGLGRDLDELAPELVSVALVPDPFAGVGPDELAALFGDVMVPFKRHFVVDLEIPREKVASRHHRYYARKVLREVEVDVVEDPATFVSAWTDLYAELVARHDLTGIQAFSRHSFARQFAVPGAVVLRARLAGRVIGAHCWYVMDEVAVSHLSAFSPAGYEHRASYALYWEAMGHFAGRVRWLNLGAGAGVRADTTDGLTAFKRGWSTETRLAYFCGRVLDPDGYAAAVEARGAVATDYFPAYRSGEFGDLSGPSV